MAKVLLFDRSASGGTKPRVTYMASYPPRECGIATFTKDLVDAVDSHHVGNRASIIALNEPQATYRYGAEVKSTVSVDDPDSYRKAADYFNRSSSDLLCIQHEYGLFGGEHGEDLLAFLDRLEKPFCLTLHTVLPRPDSHLRSVTYDLVRRADATVVLARKAVDILAEDYGVHDKSVHYIPHGVPDVRRMPSSTFKSILGLEGRLTVSTFGLINPGKGIEYAISALPRLVKKHPEILYLVLGETHPSVRKHGGEAYRNYLHQLVADLGLQKHVLFNNRYMALQEIVSYLMATNIYLVPYLNPNQIASGTLAYAVGTGRCVVSTPFIYAHELLSEGRGMLVPFRDSEAIADALEQLVENPLRRIELGIASYNYGRSMTWSSVARDYVALFKGMIRSEGASGVPLSQRFATG